MAKGRIITGTKITTFSAITFEYPILHPCNTEPTRHFAFHLYYDSRWKYILNILKGQIEYLKTKSMLHRSGSLIYLLCIGTFGPVFFARYYPMFEKISQKWTAFAFGSTKLSENVCLINTYVLIYRHARYYVCIYMCV